MKKTKFIVATLFACIFFLEGTLSANAQFKVNSNGRVLAGPYSYSGYKVGLGGSITSYNDYNIGVAGRSTISSYNGYSASICCGVYGCADNPYVGGLNYGVAGDLSSNCTAGAGVIGSTMSILGFITGGKYAGYFYGNTCVEGTLTATQVIQTSDRRLKENIIPLSSRERSTLNKVLDMNVVEYNYKPAMFSSKLSDTISVDEIAKCTGISPDKKHIGLIAQELQTIYPELVREGQDGYLGVNYVELVPVLIRAIQELKTELDDIKGTNGARIVSSTTAVNSAIAGGNVLYKNTPNPFKGKTTIRFSLADDAQSASICIFDMTGKMLKNLPVASGETSVSLNGWEFGEGMFLYTLIVNGKEIDTKRMIITN
jgi:hypothetical protein